jgi:branched-chain amino acid transport system ATP-binding protein
LLEITKLHAGYGGVPVIHGVSMQVAAGECVALLGPNNAGKTTLLRVVSGLIRASAGTIRIDGRDAAALSSEAIVDLGVIQIPEGRHIFTDLTVEDNLLVGGARLGRRRRRERLAAVYGELPRVHELRRRRAGDLSGGQQQLVVIARALMPAPRLLLIDEPSLGLSPVAMDEVFAVLRRLHRAGTTILLAEQNAELSLDLCSRGYVLQKGAVALEGNEATLRATALQEVYLT